jgi:hypothetical protein
MWAAGTFGSLTSALRATSSGTSMTLFLTIYMVHIISMAETPLMQASSDFHLWNHVTTYQSTYALSNRIPDGWTGSVDGTAPAKLFATPTFQSVLQDWYLNKTIAARDCEGTCTGEVQGAGISVQCSSSIRSVDLEDLTGFNTTAFEVKFDREPDRSGDPQLNMELSYLVKVADHCNATKETQRCSIHAALVAYPVIYERGSTFLNTSEIPHVLSLQPSLGDGVDAHDSQPARALAGLEFLAYYYLNSNVTILGDTK